MADNPYVNKVETADGTTIMDITDTTAVAGDVRSGEVFYTASGARSVGSLDVSGYVTGPSSAVDGNIAVFDGTTGKAIKDSGYTIATSVPQNAVFTDTTYSAGAGLSLSSGTFSVTGMDTSSGSTSKCLTEKGTWESFSNNAGTVTGVKVNGTTKSPSSGVVDIGTVITDVSTKADDNAVVHLTGMETITGDKIFTNALRLKNSATDPYLYFCGSDLSSVSGGIFLTNAETNDQKYGQSYFQFRQYSPASDGTRTNRYEYYMLPTVAVGLSSNAGYNIYTSKNLLSRGAASGGSDVSLVTTGEKYTWNSKANDNAVVHLSGTETITGQKIFQNVTKINNSTSAPYLHFSGKDLESSNGVILLRSSETDEQKYGQPYFQFRQYSPASNGTRTDNYENYSLPAVDVGMQSNAGYSILTTKSAVTIPQGGTGATTASGALANLGAVDKSGDTMTGNLEVQKASGSVMVAAGNTTSGLQAQLLVGSGRKNHGVYSNGYVDSNETFHSGGKWLIYRDANNHISTGGDLYSSNFVSTNYNLESVGANVAGIKSVYGYSDGTKTVSFTLTHGQHALLGIGSGFASFFNGNGTLYNTTLPSGFTAAISGSTVTITRSSTTNFFVGGIVIGSGS